MWSPITFNEAPVNMHGNFTAIIYVPLFFDGLAPMMSYDEDGGDGRALL